MSNVKEAVKDELSGFNFVFNFLLWAITFYWYLEDNGLILSLLLSLATVITSISLMRWITSKIFKDLD